MNYRTFDDLSRDATTLARSLPADVDLVVGVSGDGLLVANLLCLQLNTPMTDVQGLRDRRLLASGYRYEGRIDDFAAVDRVLVVDDVAGSELDATRASVERLDLPFETSYAAVYVDDADRDRVDRWGEVVPSPRLFEWRLARDPVLERSCVDIDGVLCRDPTPEENDDGVRYREFLRTADPELKPTVRIGWLVTSRLEAYREETEAWLDEHGVVYDELVMMDHESKAARRAAGDHGEYKAEAYRSVDADLFVESDPAQATTIAELSDKPVLCFRTNELLEPGDVARARPDSADSLSRFVAHPVPFACAALRYAATVCTGAVARHARRAWNLRTDR